MKAFDLVVISGAAVFGAAIKANAVRRISVCCSVLIDSLINVDRSSVGTIFTPDGICSRAALLSPQSDSNRRVSVGTRVGPFFITRVAPALGETREQAAQSHPNVSTARNAKTTVSVLNDDRLEFVPSPARRGS
jgi:hypothetical protein